ncbi:hypothetical protein [Klebsiella pneumoniae]|uniref:hypothetical protein n=1 Tax=Klebsiella pneumoniae TaxID=573 RepID=UPI00216342FD|nr:hypothetical protein [Klebsiella pneumoniae]MCS0552056.1 hypothetical protein [Klebsiella pneumoniae]
MIKGNVIRQANDGGNTWIDCSEEAFKRAKENGTPVREVHLREESFRAAFDVWQDKTDWVQKDRRFDVLEPWGMHRADVLKAFIEHLEGRIAELEESNAQVIQSRDHYKRITKEGLKQLRNSRTVKIPYLPDDCDRTEAHFKYQEALAAAGIKVEESIPTQDTRMVPVSKDRNLPGKVVAVHIDAGDFVKFRGQVYEVKETYFDDHDVTLWFVCGEALKCAAGCQIEVVSAPVEDE